MTGPVNELGYALLGSRWGAFISMGGAFLCLGFFMKAVNTNNIGNIAKLR